MSLIGRLLNKLFVSARVIGREHLPANDEVIYVVENSRSEHIALVTMILQQQGVAVTKRCLLSSAGRASKTMAYRLESLIEKLEFSDPEYDIKIVLVTVLHGNLPNRESSWWRVVFSERWGFKGWWNRFMQLVVNGRQTLLQFDAPLSLREVVAGNLEQTPSVCAGLVVEKIQGHFRQRREAIFGPKLLNRRQLMAGVLDSPEVQKQIHLHSDENQQSVEKSQKYARQQLNGIASNISPTFVRFSSYLLSWFFRRIYRQMKIQGIDQVRRVAKDHQLVFLPCHRSHMDYVLMSWTLHDQGIVIPHVVAGDNLNAPVLGGALKRGGAVFMRRSFYDDALYKLLFKSYIKRLHKNANALEYFIEGGRSRTGRLLPAKTGVLSMTLEASLQKNIKPIALVPVWVSYDKLVESKTYARQLLNQQKKPESLFGLVRTLKQFKGQFGDTALSFAEPILLGESFSKFESLKVKSQYIARTVMERITMACYVNESALLATVLLAQPRLRLTRVQLVERVNHLTSILVKMPNAPAGIAKGSVDTWIESALLREQLCVSGSDVYLDTEQVSEMTFYRNQIHHLTLLAGLYLLVAKRYPRPVKQSVHRLIKGVYPSLAKELFWPWQGMQVNKALKSIGSLLVDQQHILEDGRFLQVRNTAISVTLMQTVEPYLLRYYIVFRLLQEYANLTVTELVGESVRLAKLLHVEFGFRSPEYTDPQSINNFIKAMLEQQVLAQTESGVICTQVDAENLMSRSKQILLHHYLSLIDTNIRKL